MTGSLLDGTLVRVVEPSEYRAGNPHWLIEAAKNVGNDDEVEIQLPAPVAQWLKAAAARVAGGGLLVQFGAPVRRELFMLEEGALYLNHGSYGALLRPVAAAQAHFQAMQESQPVRFMETVALANVLQAQAMLARFVGACPADLVFVPNATHAISAVLASVHLDPGDMILITSHSYPAVRSAAAREAARAGAQLADVQLLDVLLLPAEERDRQLLARFEQALTAAAGRIKLAIIDHIVSFPPVHMPVRALCQMCRAHGVLVVVDGAHAVGAVPLDVTSLGCDWFTSNLHKWLCTPKGTAFLWVAPKQQATTLPLVTSHGYGLGFQGEWLWQGTSDLTGILTVPSAIAIHQALGHAAAEYRRTLLAQAVATLKAHWGAGQLVLGVDAPHACMAAVQMPAPRSQQEDGVELARRVHDALRDAHGVEVPVAWGAGSLWCRISAQIYNELWEYQRFAEVALQVLAEL